MASLTGLKATSSRAGGDHDHLVCDGCGGELLSVGAVRRAQDGNFALYALTDAVTPQLVALACDAAQRDAVRLGQLGASAFETAARDAE